VPSLTHSLNKKKKEKMNASDDERELAGREMHHRSDLELGSSSDDSEEEARFKNGGSASGDQLETDDEVDGEAELAKRGRGRGGGAKKFIPVTLAFKNLFYSVQVRKGKNPFQKKQKKTLLKDLHGELRPGEVTAIMGPSGTPTPALTLIFIKDGINFSSFLCFFFSFLY
jgi:ABC-type glutathione transport system ATPase component